MEHQNDKKTKSSLVFAPDEDKIGQVKKGKNNSSPLEYKSSSKGEITKDKSQTGILQYEKETPVKVPPKKNPKKEKTPKENTMTKKQKAIYITKIVFSSLIGIILSGSIILGLIIGNWLSDLPELDTTLLSEVSQSSFIYDINGNLISNYSSYENREWAKLEEIPKTLIDAVLSIEDHTFYEHDGLNYKRLTGAILGQLTGGDDYGGSTITQQLIKNVYLTSEVTFKRKAQEIVLSKRLESMLTKDEILEAYLNIIYLGGANYGVKMAAKDYFGKDLNELTVRECACIAGLAKNPNGYNPRRNEERGTMEKTTKRTEDVLWIMHELGKLSDEEYSAADSDTLIVAESSSHSENYPFPHYVEYVLDEVAIDLLKAENKEITSSNIMYKKYAIRSGGYKIYTALDPHIQTILQQEASTFEGYPETEDGKGVQTSAVIINQHTGEIVAMIGSKDEPVALETFNRAVDSTQPVGSTMKPIAIFAPAIEMGMSPATLTADFKSGIQGYDPANGYPGGECWNAPMTMRKALEISHNIPAARFLVKVGIEKAVDYLTQMGFDYSHISRTGSGLALGTSDATTLEMTGAYATIANGGVFIEPHSYVSVVNSQGEEILSGKDKVSRRVFSETTAWLTDDMMQGEVTRGGGRNAKIKGITTAGKTGTHEDRCITFGGYTGYYTSVIRISSDNYSAMKYASGGNQTAKLWNKYMTKIHEGLEDKKTQTKTPEELGLKKVEICGVSGKLATATCKEAAHTIYDYFAPGTEPKEYCDMHIKVCGVTGNRFVEGCDEEEEYQIVTYIGPDSYLYDVDHTILEKYLPNVRFVRINDDCDQEHLIPEETEPPTTEETEPPLIPEEVPDDGDPDHDIIPPLNPENPIIPPVVPDNPLLPEDNEEQNNQDDSEEENNEDIPADG